MINLNCSVDDYKEKLRRCQEYLNALAEERRKIQVFQKELPLSLQLVTQAIEVYKQMLTSGGNEYNLLGQSECSEETSSEGPVLQEFIPIKRAFSSSDDDEDKQYKMPKSNNNDNKTSMSSDWLRSAQPWNQSSDSTPKEDSPKAVQAVEVKRDGNAGAFHKGKKCKGDARRTGGSGKAVAAASEAEASSSADTGESSGRRIGGNRKLEKEGKSQRKKRRSWSLELHKMFLNALQQLGGSHVATPKQIKELMSVDGLTNDEVKSHLQKYRLHTRRPNPSNSNGNSPQTPPQFVVVRGLWVPPSEYTLIASTSQSGEAQGNTTNGVHASIGATLTYVQDASMSLEQRQLFKKSLLDNRGSHSEDLFPCSSQVTSSSDATTASPPAH